VNDDTLQTHQVLAWGVPKSNRQNPTCFIHTHCLV